MNIQENIKHIITKGRDFRIRPEDIIAEIERYLEELQKPIELKRDMYDSTEYGFTIPGYANSEGKFIIPPINQLPRESWNTLAFNRDIRWMVAKRREVNGL